MRTGEGSDVPTCLCGNRATINQRWLAGWVCARCARIERELEAYHSYERKATEQENAPALAAGHLRAGRQPLRVLRAGLPG